MSDERPRRRGGPRAMCAAATAAAGAGGTLLIALAFTATGAGPPAQPGHATKAHASTQAGAGATPRARPSHRAAARALARSAPVAVHIEAIGVHADEVVGLGLGPGGAIEVPEDYGVVGWYENGPSPGEVGPAVIGGHLDSDTGPAVFYRLSELRPGDAVAVERADGSTARFTVYAIEQHPKDHFPTGRVYGPSGGDAELRLITCGGRFDESAQRYRSNIVAYAQRARTP
ncbi:MAG: class F sortase [Streptosporangiales bacterium]|nr:class F sortase [Streptosporangiales bacterium]